MSGESTLVCRSDGTWHLSVPTCTACESLTTPANGNLQFLTDGTETQANYTCTVGYSISGPALLSCRSDGSWDLTPPSCVQCSVLDAPAAGHVATFTDGVATIASFSCVSGYHLDGADSPTCSAAGNWDLESPKCVCDVPTNLNNGSVDVSSDGMTATFSCDVGLSLSGAQSSVCDTLGSGWDAAWPTCVACPVLESVSNGTSQVTSDGAVTSWSVSCDVGSTVSGAISLECQPDGTWTGQLPECVSCTTLTSPINGNMHLQTDGAVTTATFTCSLGYSLSGQSEVTCQNDGSWDAPEPTCAQCDLRWTVDSGDVLFSTSGVETTASVTCGSVYHVIGDNSLTCTDSG
ncbi:SVEP1-like protein, partial [Mya arenaria]